MQSRGTFHQGSLQTPSECDLIPTRCHGQGSPVSLSSPTLSVIIPTLNAAAVLPVTLAALAGLGENVELVVTDGGSGDGTAAIAQAGGARVIAAPRGRGPQLAAGAEAATGRFFLFVHADTRLDDQAIRTIRAFLANAPRNPNSEIRAGYFLFALDDEAPAARRLERWVRWRCRWLALPYGDQGLLLSRTLYHAIGGFRPLPLMEDVDLIRRLGRARLVALDGKAMTSAERFRRTGYLRRSLRNLTCLALYGLGVPIERILRLYDTGEP